MVTLTGTGSRPRHLAIHRPGLQTCAGKLGHILGHANEIRFVTGLALCDLAQRIAQRVTIHKRRGEQVPLCWNREL